MCIKAFIYKGFQKTKQQDISSGNTSKKIQKLIVLKSFASYISPVRY